MLTIDIIFGFLAVFSLIALGWYGRRLVVGESSYLIADRGIGLFGLTATLVMTELNTSTLTAFASLGYSFGLWALVMPLIFFFGLLFYAAVVAKKWRSLAGLSVAELFTRHYGPIIGKLASGMLLIAMAGFTANYLKSLTLILSSLVPQIPLVWLSLALTITTLLMILPRGFISIVQTDAASFVSVCCILPLALFLTWDAGPPAIDFTNDMRALPLSYVTPLIFLTMFTYISAPWYGQKIFAARSKNTAFWAAFLAAFLVVALYSTVIIAAACLKGSGIALSNPDMSLSLLVNRLPPLVRGISYAVLFAIAATTLSGVWSAMVSMIIADFMGGNFSKNCRRPIRLTLVFAGISYVLSNVFIDAIFSKMILMNIPILSLSFALLAAFYWPKATRFAAGSSIVVGTLWGIFTYLYFGEGNYILYWIAGGLPLIFLTGIGLSLARPRAYMRSA